MITIMVVIMGYIFCGNDSWEDDNDDNDDSNDDNDDNDNAVNDDCLGHILPGNLYDIQRPRRGCVILFQNWAATKSVTN